MRGLRALHCSRALVISCMIFSASHVAASCAYSPPPLPSHGQGADTLGRGSLAVGAEVGWGTMASWWDAQTIADPDVNSAVVGAGRVRVGMAESLDLSLVGAGGPERAFVLGPELKWRFAHLTPEGVEGGPAFNAALISGLGVGSAEFREGTRPGQRRPRHVFLAPYTGVLASGGTQSVQMFSGLRFAVSETLGNRVGDLTLYPVLAFGTIARPSRTWAVWAEVDFASGITTRDIDDTGLILYPSGGITLTFDEVLGKRSAR